MQKRGAKKKIKKSEKRIFSYIGKGFSYYFKNLYVVLPMLIWFLIFLLLILAVILPIFIKTISPLLKQINESQGMPITNNSQLQLYSELSSTLIPFLVALSIVALILIITYLIFMSSTLEFSKNIVNKSEKGKSFGYYIKKSFSYGKKWLRYLGVKIMIFLISLPYFAILGVAFYFLSENLVGFFSVLILGSILYYLLILFISPAPYVLFYFDKGIFKSIAISAKNVKRVYGKFLLLNIFIDLIIVALSFVFSFIGLQIIISLLFSIQFKALTIMEFMKDNFKEKI